MIRKDELVEIGRFIKPHGIDGEAHAIVENHVDLDALQCVVVEMDNIPVPFFLESVRAKGSEARLIKIEGINNENDLTDFIGKPFYALESQLPETEESNDEGLYVEDLIGFTIMDSDGEIIAEITDYDDSTPNIVLIAEHDGETVYIPLAPEYIAELNFENKSVIMELPHGLLDLN